MPVAYRPALKFALYRLSKVHALTIERPRAPVNGSASESGANPQDRDKVAGTVESWLALGGAYVNGSALSIVNWRHSVAVKA